jgi:hypothetical protein
MNKICGGETSSEDTRIHVKMRHETEVFLNFFDGPFMVFNGSHSNHTAELSSKWSTDSLILRLQAPNGCGVVAFEMEMTSSAQLNSGDTFMITPKDDDKITIWMGNCSTDNEKQGAQLIQAKHFSNFAVELIDEGNETESFWNMIGGKAEYSKVKEFTHVVHGFESRLFEFSNATGWGFVKEIPNFT